MKPFDILLESSAAAHGHLCPGQVIRDGREVIQNGRVVCKPCTAACYFSDPREVAWQDMNWKPETQANAHSGPPGNGRGKGVTPC